MAEPSPTVGKPWVQSSVLQEGEGIQEHTSMLGGRWGRWEVRGWGKGGGERVYMCVCLFAVCLHRLERGTECGKILIGCLSQQYMVVFVLATFMKI